MERALCKAFTCAHRTKQYYTVFYCIKVYHLLESECFFGTLQSEVIKSVKYLAVFLFSDLCRFPHIVRYVQTTASIFSNAKAQSVPFSTECYFYPCFLVLRTNPTILFFCTPSWSIQKSCYAAVLSSPIHFTDVVIRTKANRISPFPPPSLEKSSLLVYVGLFHLLPHRRPVLLWFFSCLIIFLRIRLFGFFFGLEWQGLLDHARFCELHSVNTFLQ